MKDLADEIRSDVHGSVKDLKAELKAAARDLRREARSRGRQPDGARPGTPPWGDHPGPGPRAGRGEGWFDWHRLLDEALGPGMAAGIEGGIDIRMREEVEKAARRSGRRMPDDEQWAQIRAVVGRAVEDIRRILAREPG